MTMCKEVASLILLIDMQYALITNFPVNLNQFDFYRTGLFTLQSIPGILITIY